MTNLENKNKKPISCNESVSLIAWKRFENGNVLSESFFHFYFYIVELQEAEKPILAIIDNNM